MEGVRVDNDMLQAMRAQAEGLATRLEQMTGAMSDMQERIEAVTVTAVSRDGLVRVTVGSDGKVRDLVLDSRIYHNADSTKLASTILDTMAVAAEEARVRVLDICRPHVPAEALEQYATGDLSAAMARFRDQLPQSWE
jgi:DNA-binding protein YbaB